MIYTKLGEGFVKNNTINLLLNERTPRKSNKCKIQLVTSKVVSRAYVKQNSVDYSRLAANDDIYEMAIRFLNERSSNMYFEIVTAE